MPVAARAEAARVPAHERALFLARLFGEGLDVVVPGQHGVVGLGAEDPGVAAAVDAARLPALEDELV